MSWPQPTPGPAWNPGFSQVSPDMMNMGSYSAEQWAMIQQQNWQQWTQWQQQYAQWQSQYGEKYAEQMQGMMMYQPPPPQTAPPVPPAPPPPEKPPPPSENNQPLYGPPQPLAPVPPPTQPMPPLPPQTQTFSSVPPTQKPQTPPASAPAAHKQYWADTKNVWGNNRTQANVPQTDSHAQSSINTEALKKLAEEEKQFDIQFQKWEEEIDKWKKENVNHPDKQAYKEYEAKFEACRAQLLERRQQMKQKRASLMGDGLLETNRPEQISDKIDDSSKIVPSPLSNIASQDIIVATSVQSVSDIGSDKFDNDERAPRKNNDPIGNMNNSNSSSFLRSSDLSKGIPGLDLVGAVKEKQFEVIDITEERLDTPKPQHALDFGALSKGIHNILKDEKIMNMLSMVRHQSTPSTHQSPNQTRPLNEISQGRLSDQLFNQNQQNAQPYLQNRPFNQQHNQSQSVNKERQHDQLYIQNNFNDSSFHQKRSSDQPYIQSRLSDANLHQNRSSDQSLNLRPLDQSLNFRPPDQSINLRPPDQSLNSRPPDQSLNLRPPDQSLNLRPPDQSMNLRPPDQSLNLRPPDQSMNLRPPDQSLNLRPSDQSFPQNRYNNQNYNQSIIPNDRMYNPPRPQSNYGQSGMSYESGEVQGRNDNFGQWNSSGNETFNSAQRHEYNQNDRIAQPTPLMDLKPMPDFNRSGPPHLQKMMSSNMTPRMNNFSDTTFNMNEEFDNSNDYNDNDNFYGNDHSFQTNPQPTKVYEQQQFHNPGVLQRPNHSQPNPNLPLNRPPLHDMTGQQNSGLNVDKSLGNIEPIQQPKFKWTEEPIFVPSIIVEYEHKPLRLKAREFIEPVQIFDYNHQTKDDGYKRNNLDISENMLFQRKRDVQVKRSDFDDSHRSSYKPSRDSRDRSPRDRDFEKYDRPKVPYKEDPLRNDSYGRGLSRDTKEARDLRETRDKRDDKERYEERRRYDDRYYDRRNEERDRYKRDSSRDRDRYRSRPSPDRRENKYSARSRSRSHDRDTGKRAHSKDFDTKDGNVSQIPPKEKEPPKAQPAPVQRNCVVMIDDLLEPPGRDIRPEKIIIILRGAPGSGKSYLAQLIREREIKYGGNVRIMSIDDYFTQETEVEEKDPSTGKMVKKTIMKYEYDAGYEDSYLTSFKKAFKRSLSDGFHSFLIFDAVNETLKSYADVWNFAKQNGFQVYICTMEMDVQTCFKRNIHNRSLEEIECIVTRFFKTPAHHLTLDPTTLLQSAAIDDVHMEDVVNEDDVIMEDAQEEEEEVTDLFTSKWDRMEDADKLERLDGTSRPLRPSHYSMDAYLQIDDWQPTVAKPGKKTVRWADIEERRKQEKMRAVGFVVGQTDWDRMTDPTLGSSALTQTKYIERVRRNHFY